MPSATQNCYSPGVDAHPVRDQQPLIQTPSKNAASVQPAGHIAAQKIPTW